MQLGILYFNAPKPEDARQAFQEVVRLAPQSENARLAKQYLDFLNRTKN
jgi:hypothetical protein